MLVQQIKPSLQSSFIHIVPNALTPEQCDNVVARFDADPRKQQSRTSRGVNPKVRTGTMLPIPVDGDWTDISTLVEATFYKFLPDYVATYPVLESLVRPDRSMLTSPLIEKINPGQGFTWHIDAGPAGTQDRILSSIIYLRDVSDGGMTEFPYQQIATKSIKGSMVIFPPFWTHLHRGAPPARETKYNITNFLCLKPEG